MAGIESGANAQIEALMKNHALTGHIIVIYASNYVDDQCIAWMKDSLGEEDSVKAGGGCSAIVVIEPAGPHEGATEKLVTVELDLSQLGQVKLWIDPSGHYRRPEVVKSDVIKKPLWANDAEAAAWPDGEEDQELKKDIKVAT